MKELFEDKKYLTGLIIGILYIGLVSIEIYMLHQWHWIYVVPYLVMSIFQMVTVDDVYGAGSFRFITGMNIPIFIMIVVLFFIVDMKQSTKNS